MVNIRMQARDYMTVNAKQKQETAYIQLRILISYFKDHLSYSILKSLSVLNMYRVLVKVKKMSLLCPLSSQCQTLQYSLIPGSCTLRCVGARGVSKVTVRGYSGTSVSSGYGDNRAVQSSINAGQILLCQIFYE